MKNVINNLLSEGRLTEDSWIIWGEKKIQIVKNRLGHVGLFKQGDLIVIHPGRGDAERLRLCAELLDHLDKSGLVPAGDFAAGLRMYLQLALLRVVGTGEIDRLPRRRDEQLQNLRVVVDILEDAVIHVQSPEPVLLIHKGQESPELSQEFLSVNGFSPPLPHLSHGAAP